MGGPGAQLGHPGRAAVGQEDLRGGVHPGEEVFGTEGGKVMVLVWVFGGGLGVRRLAGLGLSEVTKLKGVGGMVEAVLTQELRAEQHRTSSAQYVSAHMLAADPAAIISLIRQATR